MNNKKMLIVHADDYGLTKSVSIGIIRAHREGIVTSTSVIANMVTDEEIDKLIATPSLDVGLHFTLTQGRSVLPKEEVQSLVDEKGMFYKRKTKERPVDNNGFISFPNARTEEILVELEAQLFKLKNAGLVLSHIDTHHHIHADGKVMTCVIYVASKHNLAVRSINSEMRETLIENSIRTSDFFEERFFSGDNITVENFLKITSDLQNGVTELMCHPGEVKEELRKISSYAEERATELETLINPEIKNHLQLIGVELVSWREVML